MASALSTPRVPQAGPVGQGAAGPHGHGWAGAQPVEAQQSGTWEATATPPRTSFEGPREHGGGRAGGRGGGGWRGLVVAALVAAVVSVSVAVPATFAVVDRIDADAAAAADADEDAATAGTDTAGLDQDGEGLGADSGATLSGVADVAAAVSPAVAYVEVAGPRGQGSGSAVIIDADGYLLTNHHVIDGALGVSVTLADGSRYDAQVVGSDPTSDIAVLRIDGTDLPAVEVSDQVEVGDPVVAIGSPFGLEGSVTSGIVSAVDRTIGGSGGATLVGLIQTDAAINPGNSGGALVDGQGRLIGINTAIFSTSGSSSGIGFAVPAATAMTVADQLIAGGTVRYAQLGITGSDATPAIAEAYDLPADSGALVASVLPGSGADAAGLRARDVIVAVGERDIASMTQLTAAIRGHQPGDEVTLTVVRDSGRVELDVTLGSQDGP